MERIVWHWSAGGHKANGTDKKHYNLIIEGDGGVVKGNYPISANEDTSTPYAAHTRGLNTNSIGLSLAAMRGAKERPFNAGPSPITEKQVASLIRETARLCVQYDIPVTRETVLSHAEVQPTLGVRQRAKWDITWLPGMAETGDPIEIGDKLRARVRAAIRSTQPQVTIPTPSSRPGWFAALLRAIFGGKA